MIRKESCANGRLLRQEAGRKKNVTNLAPTSIWTESISFKLLKKFFFLFIYWEREWVGRQTESTPSVEPDARLDSTTWGRDRSRNREPDAQPAELPRSLLNWYFLKNVTQFIVPSLEVVTGVHWFLVDGGINTHHKLGDLKWQKFMPSGVWRREVPK